MGERISEIDQQLRETPFVALLLALDKNRAKRNACIFFCVIFAGLVFFLSWNKWLYLVPASLGIGAFLYHMNIVIVSSELKRRPRAPEALNDVDDNGETS
ncbi:hypothetical protein [Oleiharenicola lentus]|uniref:hypothetical protein n=1 Tax=Oleiharenicola lentus TaxID=2508720 RepID=UPI003F67E550